jgi:hypothetical protein
MKFFLLGLFILSGCASKPKVVVSTPKELLFIHGAHFDASSWNEIRKITDAKYPSLAPTTGMRTLHEGAGYYCSQIPNKSIIIAHSYGGAIANEMTGVCPNKIEAIIYVTAVSPHSGEMAFDLIAKKDQQGYASIVNFTKKLVVPKKRDKFLKKMAGRKISNPKIKIFSEPSTVGRERLNFDQVSFNKIPKAYIFAEDDLIISLKSQKMYASREVLWSQTTVKSGHLPMITASEALGVVILDTIGTLK